MYMTTFVFSFVEFKVFIYLEIILNHGMAKFLVNDIKYNHQGIHSLER